MVVIFSTIWIRIFYENKKFLHFPRTRRFPSMSIPNSPNSSINLFSISRSAILVAIPLKFAKILSAVTTQVVFLYREGIYDNWMPILLPLLIFDLITFSRRVTAWCWHDQQKIKCRPIRAREIGGVSLSGCYMPSTTRYSQRRKAELFHSVNNSTVLCRLVASLTDALFIIIYLFILYLMLTTYS